MNFPPALTTTVRQETIMATQAPTAAAPHTTTLLGQTYPGRPMSLALSMFDHEQRGNSDKARVLLDAHNRIRMVSGQQPYNLAADFTEEPMEGGFTIRAVPPIAVKPRPLNERLWELVGKETARTIAPAESVELNALCVELEGAAA